MLDLTDALALRSIRRLASEGALAALVKHPVFQDGISEDETTLVAAVGTMSEHPDDVSRMLNPGYATIESFSIATALLPIVNVSIVRVGDASDSYAADAIADAGPFVESAMLLPLPVEHLILVLHDSAVTDGAAGTNYGFAFSYRPKDDQPPDTFEGRHFPGGIVHEIAHYYWSGHEGWIDEGLANTIAHMYGISNGLSPGQLRTRREDCEAHDLEMLSEWDPPIGDSRYECNYYLGERLFLGAARRHGGRRVQRKATRALSTDARWTRGKAQPRHRRSATGVCRTGRHSGEAMVRGVERAGEPSRLTKA